MCVVVFWLGFVVFLMLWAILPKCPGEKEVTLSTAVCRRDGDTFVDSFERWRMGKHIKNELHGVLVSGATHQRRELIDGQSIRAAGGWRLERRQLSRMIPSETRIRKQALF